MTDKELLVTPKKFPDPDRRHFDSSQEYYSDNVKSWLDAWFYNAVMDYLKGHQPNELLRTDRLANKEHLYNMYVEHCSRLNVLCSPLEELERELNEILEVWTDVFRYTEFDPDLSTES